MPDYLLAIDQGTTSTRAILFDAALAPVATAQQEFAQIYPAPGLVEHDPEHNRFCRRRNGNVHGDEDGAGLVDRQLDGGVS